MASSSNIMITARVLGVFFVVLAATAAQQPASAASLPTEHNEQVLLARTDPEMNIESWKQLAQQQQQQQQPHQTGGQQQQLVRLRRQAGFARKLQQSINNEADIAALLSQQQQLKHAGGASSFPVQQASQLALQQQQLAEDEQAIKRQLHELIAQAPNDKTIERALLKMVINASLRSALNNGATTAQQSSPLAPYYTAANANRNLIGATQADGSWQDGSFDNGNNNGFDGVPHLSARLEQAIGDYANIDTLANDLSLSLPLQEQFQSSLDKREYIKPCSFNAVSCAKLRRPL